jgi:23S rRNA pseudouridine1911/1915/1917 synthase
MSFRFVVDAAQAEQRVDKLLAQLLSERSRATLQRWIAEGRVLVDGRICRAKDKLRAGAVIEVAPGPAPLSETTADASVVFDVVHEDEHLLVVDKPAGLVVHPARGHRGGTLVNGLLARPGFASVNADQRDPTGALRPGIVHRIDKGTSGLLVVAKDERTREGLKAQLAAHTVERSYLALTIGVPKLRAISSWYGRDPKSRLRFSSRVRSGRRAVTHLAVAERLAGERAALVRCSLETGRTHQIRVHLWEQAQTPLLGDPLYAGVPADSELSAIAAALGRQALHAEVLGFVHPVTGRALRFEAPPATDFQRALSALRELGAGS